MEKLSIESVNPSTLGSNSYIVLLRSEESRKLFPIVIGAHEAQIISVFLEGLEIKRPLTHQLFINFLNLSNFKIEKIIINKFEEGIFFSKIHFFNKGNEIQLDARPSDAIALAIKLNAPIYISKAILNEVELNEEEIMGQGNSNQNSIENKEELSLEGDLNEQLVKALENENYELAAKIRDKINKKNLK